MVDSPSIGLPSGPHPALLQDAVLQLVLARADGTTLTRAGAVCKTWRDNATSDALWRNLVFNERGRHHPAPIHALEAPAWAIEAPRTPNNKHPARSWRQAYRLLAMLERGRANCLTPIPSIETDTALNLPRLRQPDKMTHWLDLDQARAEVQHYLGPLGALRQEMVTRMVGRRRQVQYLRGVAAVRDVRGQVLLAWGGADGLQSWHLPLRALGCLAAEVRLSTARPSAAPGVAGVHVLTRSGSKWLRWQAHQPQPAAVLHGRVGRVVHLRGEACWLAAGIPEGTRESFGLFNLRTGRVLEKEEENHRLQDAAFLTEFGPVVAWAPGAWHLRIAWSTRPEAAALPANRGGNTYWRNFWGNRPLRLDPEQLPADAQLFDMRLSTDRPGRVLVGWTSPSMEGKAGCAFIDGWGSWDTCLELSSSFEQKPQKLKSKHAKVTKQLER